jgi:protein-arginine kinase activator protein McsA
MKTCSKCKEEKEFEEFSRTGRGEKLRASLCRPCSSKKASEWNKRNPKKRRINSRRHKLKKQYGITPEKYNEMSSLQEGKCAICDRTEKLVVDHNHATGKVRSLLCRLCNSGIGYFKEDVTIMRKAIKYVTKRVKAK